MTAPIAPAILHHLEHEKNVAADAVIADALPDLTAEPVARRTLFSLLVRRGHVPSLTSLVRRFHTLDEELRRLIADRAVDMGLAIRKTMASPHAEHRAAAVEVIRLNHSPTLAYLLADALRGRCPQTRQRAAVALREMIERHLDESPLRRDRSGHVDGNARREHALLADAVQAIVTSWENHLQPTALEAALWMIDEVVPVVVRKLSEPRSRIASAAESIIAGASDPRLAGFVLQALTIPELRDGAATRICDTEALPFRRALIAEAWRLDDPELEKACRRVKQCPWLHDSVDDLKRAADGSEHNAMRLALATSRSPERRYAILASVIDHGTDGLVSAIVELLAEDQSTRATDLLKTIAHRSNDGPSAAAQAQLAQRRRPLEPSAPAAQPSNNGPPSTPHQPHEPASRSNAENQKIASAGSLPEHPHTPAWSAARDPAIRIRALAASSTPTDRVTALQEIRSANLMSELEEQVYKMAFDAEPKVRSVAVSLLVHLPGSAGRRILRAALSDPDPRVQANAIEALDLLDAPDRAADTVPKLSSPNSRVRANAIRSLLRLDIREAAGALLDMLEDDSSSHRISALWLIERLNLRSVLRRVELIQAGDPDERVRQRARRIMQEAGKSRARPDASHVNIHPARTPGADQP